MQRNDSKKTFFLQFYNPLGYNQPMSLCPAFLVQYIVSLLKGMTICKRDKFIKIPLSAERKLFCKNFYLDMEMENNIFKEQKDRAREGCFFF